MAREDLSGKGSHGFHEGHLMFNEDDVLIMFVVAVPEDMVKPIFKGLAPFYNEHTGDGVYIGYPGDTAG